MNIAVAVLATALLLASAWTGDDAIVGARPTAIPQSTHTNLQSPDAITIPQMLSYQGKLTDTLGQPVADTLYAVRFRLYAQASGGTHFWEENQSVRTKGGLFSTLLGSVTPIGSMPDGGAVYLGMAVAGGAELTPRLRIASAAYSYLSERAANADLLQGKDTTGFVRAGQANSVTSAMIVNGTVAAADLNQMGASSGQVMKWTGSAWQPRNDSVGSGGGGDNAWVRSGSDSVLYTINRLGIARGGSANMLHGTNRFTHVNFGVECTTGLSGQNYSYATVGGGRSNAASNLYATVAGGLSNTASAGSATVGGGYNNDATGSYATVGGGYSNAADSTYATVGGGYSSDATGYAATIAGGYSNAADSTYATVGGGYSNDAIGYAATVAGGYNNIASGSYATVGGGWADTADARYSAAISGYRNVAGDGSEDTAAVVVGGGLNRATARYATVGGGYNNGASGNYATVGGGGQNAVSGSYATVSGGVQNTASGSRATVGGGGQNTVSGGYATIGGGQGNAASGSYATVAGGVLDTSAADYSFTTGYGSVVPSGYNNSAAFNGQTATAANQTRVGALSKASGTFTIDHPLDPSGKILNHYFIEGPEMLNIYRGSVILDAVGRAEVSLPDYFSALNRNPMVQLTGVGTSEVVYVAEKVAGNRFAVGGPAGAEVYWQVTGERRDMSAEATRRMMPVEQAKTGALAGRMLDDDFLRGCMDQLVREGKSSGIDFRTAGGRARYEKMRRLAGEK